MHSIFQISQLVAARCKTVLGFEPPIERVAPAPDELVPHLDYSIAKLKATGFSLLAGCEDEIDATLLLCQREFGSGA